MTSPDKRGAGREFAIAAATHFVLMLGLVVALYPVLWVLSIAFSPDGSAGGALPLPASFSIEHFATLFEGDAVFLLQLGNSLLVAFATALVAVAIAAPAAYAMSRFDFYGRKATTRTLLATQMFPGVAAAIPLFLILDFLGLIDTRLGLVLVYATTAVPFAIFQLRGAFDGIPKDLEEAAMVDGATRFVAFIRVILPAARPALAVTVLFAFMTAWNEFILAATFMAQESTFTAPVALQRYVGEFDAQWGVFSAGAVVVSLPVMLLFYALQRHLVGGLAGSVKG
ncbi:MAG: ABC transporter permease subunit [Myxococcota bacterium]